MNPDDIPVKFPLHTRVRITRGINVGYTGHIIMERHDGKNNHVSFDEGGHAYFSDHELEALLTPEVGDLVRIKASGRWQAHEGHIVSENIGTLTVDFGYDEKAAFGATALEVIEKVKPKPVRIEGKPIQPDAIKRGDTISVVTIEDLEVKKTLILEATVDKIVPKSGGEVLHFQTRGGAHIFTADKHIKSAISLVKSIDNDVDFQTLSQAKIGDVISFADNDGEAETNLAVKREEDLWSVMEESKTRNVATVGLVNILKKRNVGYTVVRTVPVKGLPFPIGTNVKVNSGFSTSLSQGDYRVVIAGDTNSTIKSRGISAATHSVPNRWLIKDL